VNKQRIEQHGFRLVEQIDETSKTVVWKAIQETLDRTVVLRILKDEGTASSAEIEHFLRLARRFARVKSDSLAAVFDIVSEQNLHYVVTEHVQGPTLAELVARQGPLPVEQTLRIAASLITSLEQLWATAHIVHRNLKSSTIRLDPRGVAKITDFSLAIEAGPGVDATAMDGGLIVGTPCYLSPEQSQGSHMLNTQSDMYALGVVLYHLSTGVVPFEDLDVVAILAAHIKQQIPPPHLVRREIPIAFSWFLHRLMMKNPNNRYANWDDVLLDIRHLLNGSAPSCIRPDEEYLSTISSDFTLKNQDPFASGDEDKDVPRVRLSRKPKNDGIAAYQSKKLVDEHADEIRRETVTLETVCWTLLAVWLVLVFWFRAVYQSGPLVAESPLVFSQLSEVVTQLSDSFENIRLIPEERVTTEPLAHEAGAGQTSANPSPDVVAATGSTVSQQSETPPQPASGIPPLLRTELARALALGDINAARQLVQANTERFAEKNELVILMDQIPEPDRLVAAYLEKQIGETLAFEHNGKQRTVVPRGVENGLIQLEANGRSAEFPITKLTPDEKLRWMEPPKNAAHLAAYCMTLMRSSRRAELQSYATGCPLLAPILIEAAGLVKEEAATTPPVE